MFLTTLVINKRDLNELETSTYFFQSLTLNDLKLHASVSDVVLLSFNLTAGTIVPSQAGYNLSIADNVNSTQLLVSICG